MKDVLVLTKRVFILRSGPEGRVTKDTSRQRLDTPNALA
jgi:hypothetical protein